MTSRAFSYLALLLCASLAPQADQTEELKGYAEWRKGAALIVDGQRVVTSAATKVTGTAKTPAEIAIGFEVKAKGARRADGALVAASLEAKPNGSALFESEILSTSNDIERQWVTAGAVTEEEEVDGKTVTKVVGKLVRTGPEIDRVRRLVDRLAPPGRSGSDYRLYVVLNDDWNAMAMANGAIWVFKGLLDGLNDNDVAIVLGHEIAHVTHEHLRRAYRRAIWTMLLTFGGIYAAESIDNDAARVAVQIAAVVGPMLLVNKYDRTQEDQADRVGLRYAYEAGFDPSAGPRLWERFRQKYGDTPRIVNFIVGSHSTMTARMNNLKKQLALNYANAVDSPASGSGNASASSMPRALGLTQYAMTPAPAAPPPSSSMASAVWPGMTMQRVRQILGEPARTKSKGTTVRWTYEEFVIVFSNSRLKDVEFLDPNAT